MASIHDDCQEELRILRSTLAQDRARLEVAEWGRDAALAEAVAARLASEAREVRLRGAIEDRDCGCCDGAKPEDMCWRCYALSLPKPPLLAEVAALKNSLEVESKCTRHYRAGRDELRAKLAAVEKGPEDRDLANALAYFTKEQEGEHAYYGHLIAAAYRSLKARLDAAEERSCYRIDPATGQGYDACAFQQAMIEDRLRRAQADLKAALERVAELEAKR